MEFKAPHLPINALTPNQYKYKQVSIWILIHSHFTLLFYYQTPINFTTTMAGIGKLDVEVELKTNAVKFWESIRDSQTVFPKALPQEYKSIQILEGDGKCVGSVRLVHFGEASPIVTFSKEKIDAVDEEKKAESYSVVEGDLLKFYKRFKAKLTVSPKGEGSLVKWGCEFEKASDDIPDPNIIRDFAVESFTKLDAYLQA